MIYGLTAQASNIKRSDHPPYTADDFLDRYPQFEGNIPKEVLDDYVEMGLACVNYRRFNHMWKTAMGFFIAHFCTMYMQSMLPGETSAAAVVAKASSVGIITGESADGVSYSRDGSALNDLAGWAAFKATTFGIQFATMAKMAGKGGMYVW